MRTIIIFIVFVFFLANLAWGQVKFRVKKLNTDSLVELLSKKEGKDKVDLLNLLSNVICRKNIDSSINLAAKAIELSEILEYQKGLADGYFNVGNGFFLMDSLQPTISNYLKALRIYEDLELSEEYGNLCMQLGLINYFSGRLEVTSLYFRHAQSIYKKIDDNAGQSMAYQGMGVMKDILYNELDSAIYYYKKALSFLDPSFDQNQVAYNYQEIGVNYNTQFHNSNDTSYFNKALSFFYKALDLSEINAETRASIYYYLGQAYLNSNSDKSESKGMECFKKANNIYDTCSSAYKYDFGIIGYLGLAYYRKGDYEKAIFHYKQGIKIIEERLSNFSIEEFREPVLAYNLKYFLKIFKQSIYESLYYTYAKLNDYKTAHEFYTLSKEAEEEIYMEKNQNLITMLESISEDEKTEKQMALLAKDNELKELAVKQSRIYVLALVGFILILVLVALLFIRQRQTRVLVREQKLLHDLELKNMESEKLKELDHLKSRFFANISHEFRTPLTLIKGPLEKVLSNPEDKNIIKELGVANKYTGKLQVLINNLLTISKLESGKMELHASETDVVKLVGTYIQSFESLAKQKNIALNFNAEKEIKAYIDRKKFEQVLNNLLSNAFKFTGDGGKVEVEVCCPQSAVGSRQSVFPGKLTADCELKTADSDSQWVGIKISDTGPGIPPEHVNHIFDRFYQVGQENNSYFEGTGIGLALTKELVELHHGKIEVESEQGKGSTFTILLPLGKDHLNEGEIVDQNESSKFEVRGSNTESQMADIIESEFTEVDLTRDSQHKASSDQHPVTSNQQPETSNQQPILLIVEDNADMRSYIRGYFENEYSIIEAIDGVDGYEKSTANIPNIIISDVMMPNMDGNEFCRKVKTDERTSHIPVILLTARASKESRIEGLETGADDFITKPFDGDELQVRVKNLFDQRKRLSSVLEKKFQKSHSTANLDFEDSGITSMDDNFLQKAREIVSDNLSNPDYTIEDFASAMALSRYQLHRKLKALINNSGTEFIRTIRLNFAIGLLQKKAGTISEIAYDCGFNNPTYFSKIFKQKYGMSPSEYQNNLG